MAHFSIIKLSHLTPLHIDTGRESYDFSSGSLHSDTLLSALASIMALRGEALGIESFLQSTRVSSAFPFYGEHLFMPVPKGRLNVKVAGEDESLYRKDLKKVRYMEMPLWQHLVGGERVSIERRQLQGEYILSEATMMPSRISNNAVNERVSVPRSDAKDSEPFFFEWKYFDKEAGLFVLTDVEGSSLEGLLSLFELLGQQGVGTDKSVGGGKFEVDYGGTVDFKAVENAGSVLLLSLYLPTPEEMETIDLENSRYSLLLRGGYMAGSQEETLRHLRKKSVYMMETGSVLQTSQPLEGKVTDLRPEWSSSNMHPVYRSGKLLSLPINI